MFISPLPAVWKVIVPWKTAEVVPDQGGLISVG